MYSLKKINVFKFCLQNKRLTPGETNYLLIQYSCAEIMIIRMTDFYVLKKYSALRCIDVLQP